VAVAIVLALVLFFVTGGEDPQDLPAAAPGGGGVAVPMTVEEIRTQSPTLNPARTINRAKGVADVADQRNEELKEINRELNE
jgi:predicted transglutaminase-like cysteine proteinase